MRRSTRLEPISAPSSKTSIIEAGCIQRSATNPRLSSKPNSANSKPSERTQPRLCHSNPVSQPRGAVQTLVRYLAQVQRPPKRAKIKAAPPERYQDKIGSFGSNVSGVVGLARRVDQNQVRAVRPEVC